MQIAYAKALLVDHDALARMQGDGEVIRAEECLKDAFLSDVRPLLGEVRTEMGLDPDPMAAFRRSGYSEKIRRQRRDAS